MVPRLVPLARRLRRASAIVAWSQKAFVMGALAAPLVRRPFVWALHDILSAEHFSPTLQRTAATLARLTATAVVANSVESRNSFVAAAGARPPCAIIEPGIDLARYAASAAPIAAAPPRTDRAVLVHVGRLSPWKGQDVLLEAIAAVPDVEAWIVGDAQFGEADHAAALRRRATAPDLAGRVHWLGHRDDVPALLQRADLFVHVPTAAEPFGQTVVEAMAAGLPVIVSDKGAPRRVVGPEAGVVVPSGDPVALAAAICDLIVAPDRRAQLAVAARHRAQHYGIAHNARQWRATLHDVLGPEARV
jgi:glycosyltransferase involved in cell wall biosynthesis